MKPDIILRRNLARKLRQLLERRALLDAEIELVRQLIAGAERGRPRTSIRLRSNSIAKLTAQAQIRRWIEESFLPVKAQHLYDRFLHEGISINPSTFRSYLRRMVEDGIIEADGPRGHYSLALGRSDATRER